MGTKWKKFSCSTTTIIIAFITAILCFSGALTLFLKTMDLHSNDLGIAFEDSYYLSKDYINDSSKIIDNILAITKEYKSEEHILNGGTIAQDDILTKETQLYNEFEYNSKSYNPNLSRAENYEVFKEVYAEKLSGIRDQLIEEDLKEYQAVLRRLEKYQGVFYCGKNGDFILSNSPNQVKEYFKSFPSYIVLDSAEQGVFLEEIKDNKHYHRVSFLADKLGTDEAVYVAFTKEYLNTAISEWEKNKTSVTNSLYQIAGLLLGLMIAFLYLVLIIGRKPDDDDGIHLNPIDRIYTDLNLAMCLFLIAIWPVFGIHLNHSRIYQLIFPVTLVIAACGLILVLSLIKHIKNRTFIKHSLLYVIIIKLYEFVKDVFDSGSTAVKVVLIVIGYPIIATLTFFMFPITIGLAAWLALKKVKEYEAIKEGVKKVKEGNLHYTINVDGDGEFAQLAADINSITDGLNKAVENEIKSERLKSELITNVSHDIRTPLTSIITYVDLLKKEEDQEKVGEYIDIIDQKSQRLKTLTGDLFEAAKASSGNVPVNYEKIDIVSLLTQGLGEFDDRIQEQRLEFKLSHPGEKVYINADGRLLWRAIENLLLNIFKYALEGSRVYIDIIDSGSGITMMIKNISAYELNISSDELMERFKRGDESRSSQGSGLGLSIARSLIEIQKGTFNIEIDGDLFKAIIHMPKYTL